MTYTIVSFHLSIIDHYSLGIFSQIQCALPGIYFGFQPSLHRIVGHVSAFGMLVAPFSARFVDFWQVHVSVMADHTGKEPGEQVVAALQMNSPLSGLQEHCLVREFQKGWLPCTHVVARRHRSFSPSSSNSYGWHVHVLVLGSQTGR